MTREYRTLPRPQGVKPQPGKERYDWWLEQVMDLAPRMEEMARRQAEEDDPTPWCHICGAMTRSRCKCGPIARTR